MGINLPSLRSVLYGGLIAAAFSSCSIFDTSEKIPAYIHIDKIAFIPASASWQSPTSVKITDAWVYIDGQLVGAYELPCTFPVQCEGTHNILVEAGIKQN